MQGSFFYILCSKTVMKYFILLLIFQLFTEFLDTKPHRVNVVRGMFGVLC